MDLYTYFTNSFFQPSRIISGMNYISDHDEKYDQDYAPIAMNHRNVSPCSALIGSDVYSSGSRLDNFPILKIRLK